MGILIAVIALAAQSAAGAAPAGSERRLTPEQVEAVLAEAAARREAAERRNTTVIEIPDLEPLPPPQLQGEFGIGLGTLVLLTNVVLLGSYTFGCHSGRHLFGGRKDEVSKSPVLSACYDCVTGLNTRHMQFAWMSLFSVALADVYVRLCSMGVITDLNTW